MDIRQFNREMQRLQAAVMKAAVIGVGEAAELVRDTAKDRIDNSTDLLPLADATVEEKEALHFPPDPLLRTGTLRDSIKVEQVGLTAQIGSELDYAFYQEHGTTTIPPRPFLAPALFEKTPEVLAIIEANIAKVLKKVA